jgi:hypothetical protein
VLSRHIGSDLLVMAGSGAERPSLCIVSRLSILDELMLNDDQANRPAPSALCPICNEPIFAPIFLNLDGKPLTVCGPECLAKVLEQWRNS